jgi:hypothetical protein
VKRATHYAAMNQFMNWDNDPGWTERVVAKAMELDQKVASAGSTSAIARVAPEMVTRDLSEE